VFTPGYESAFLTGRILDKDSLQKGKAYRKDITVQIYNYRDAVNQYNKVDSETSNRERLLNNGKK